MSKRSVLTHASQRRRARVLSGVPGQHRSWRLCAAQTRAASTAKASGLKRRISSHSAAYWGHFSAQRLHGSSAPRPSSYKVGASATSATQRGPRRESRSTNQHRAGTEVGQARAIPGERARLNASVAAQARGHMGNSDTHVQFRHTCVCVCVPVEHTYVYE